MTRSDGWMDGLAAGIESGLAAGSSSNPSAPLCYAGWKEQETVVRAVMQELIHAKREAWRPDYTPEQEACCQGLASECEAQLQDGAPRYKAQWQSMAYAGQNTGVKPMPSPPLQPLDPVLLRRDFPILAKPADAKALVWFDNGATTQKPRCVMERIRYFYENENSNVHRGAHALAVKATDAYEGAREKVRQFIQAAHTQEIIFTRGATESINLVAASFGRMALQPGDEVIVSELEHHANIVPWQLICREKGARLLTWPVTKEGSLDLNRLSSLLGPRTRLVAVAQVSNVLGTVTPLEEIIALAHEHGAAVLVDGAQSVPHMPVNVQALDCDFFVFSGHKVYGPTGIGVLYAKKKILESMPPYQTGGNMIADVTFERSLYQPPPRLFEAGTGNIADAAGLGAALDYAAALGLERIEAYEADLLRYATQGLAALPKVRLLALPERRAGVVSFTVEGVLDQAVGEALSREGIAVRAGHHCALPVLRRLGRESAVRASFSFYNTKQEVDFFLEVLGRV